MKQIFLLGLIVTQCVLANAKALDRPTRALRVQDQIAEEILDIKGVNGIGIGGCNPETGEQDILGGDFVHCVVISGETKRAVKALLKLYPQGTQLDGVFIAVKYLGVLRPEPRMSAGN